MLVLVVMVVGVGVGVVRIKAALNVPVRGLGGLLQKGLSSAAQADRLLMWAVEAGRVRESESERERDREGARERERESKRTRENERERERNKERCTLYLSMHQDLNVVCKEECLFQTAQKG